jgi:transposase
VDRPSGADDATCHWYFTTWTKAGVWTRLHHLALDQLGARGLLDWSRACVDSQQVRAKRGDKIPVLSPADRAKPGSKPHILSDAGGLPLAAGISAANVHDSPTLPALVRGIPAIRRRGPRRRRPVKLHADKGYESAANRMFLRGRGIIRRIARNGVESTEKLGRHRYKIERTFAWLGNYRRLAQRWERNTLNFKAFLALACAMVCYRRLRKHLDQPHQAV